MKVPPLDTVASKVAALLTFSNGGDLLPPGLLLR
jgi:hypothetical protein